MITDVDVLVALYTQAEHLKLLNCPLLSPCYSWTIELLDGLDVYCQFHQKQLRDKEIKGEEGTHASEFSDVLTSLREVLKSGWRQRCEDHRIRALVEKKQVDLKLIKEIKVEKLQEAVLKGYIVLERIKQKYHGQASLPRKIRGLANACMAGGIAFDTFPGRKGEWEGLKFIYGSKVLEGMLDHFVCSEHKTWQVYGSIAKLLTPGLFQAFCCYKSLCRPEDCTIFLVPANDTSGTVSLPKSLQRFCKLFLGDKHVWPTFNQVRKFFHRALMDLTSNTEQLKELMVILDAHSKQVQDRHYILRDPEDDVKLAKELVKAVLGRSVTWPTAADVNKCQLGQALELILEGKASDEELQEEEEETSAEEDEEELEYWEFGEFFGVPKPLLALTDSDKRLPLADAPLENMALQTTNFQEKLDAFEKAPQFSITDVSREKTEEEGGLWKRELDLLAKMNTFHLGSLMLNAPSLHAVLHEVSMFIMMNMGRLRFYRGLSGLFGNQDLMHVMPRDHFLTLDAPFPLSMNYVKDAQGNIKKEFIHPNIHGYRDPDQQHPQMSGLLAIKYIMTEGHTISFIQCGVILAGSVSDICHAHQMKVFITSMLKNRPVNQGQSIIGQALGAQGAPIHIQLNDSGYVVKSSSKQILSL